ncbi:Reverse transcriptase [Phytophthora palmivora]|uniref:Reverse transcriptase n=1 Tax=Phytophthora palmivora TaxID=4796 RepID=A0A2P4XWF2_9STRA|nr:Reverse transcriptase [Phytophthora palmivora]
MLDLCRAPGLAVADKNYTLMVRFMSDSKDAKVDRLSPRQRAQLHRYELAEGLLHYRVDPRDPPRVVVPNDEDLKYDILLEAHDAPISGHLSRAKAYQATSQTFWWSACTSGRHTMSRNVNMSEGEAFGPRLGSATVPSRASGLLEVDPSRLRLRPTGR